MAALPSLPTTLYKSLLKSRQHGVAKFPCKCTYGDWLERPTLPYSSSYRSRDCIYYCKLQADWVQYKAVFKSQHGVLDYHTAAFLTFSLFLVKSSYLFTLWMEIWAGDIAITSSVIALHYVTFDRILDSRVLAFSPPLFHFFFLYDVIFIMEVSGTVVSYKPEHIVKIDKLYEWFYFFF